MALSLSATKYRKGFRRAFSALLVVVTIATELVIAAPVSAGTLTSPTWTVMDPRTNIAGNRYDYGFTTATTGTVSRVTATVPAGTTGSNRYLVTQGVSGNAATTPDSTANSVTGDLDIRAYIAPQNWTPASYQRIVEKPSEYALTLVSSGKLELDTTDNASNNYYNGSSGPTGFVNGSAHWVRATLQVNNGSGGRVLTFYTSTDGTNWTQFGSQITIAGAITLNDSANALTAGQPGANSFAGKIYYEDIRSGIGGTTSSSSTCSGANVVNCFNPNNDAVAGTSWTSADTTGETWTVNRSGTNAPADIASDLSVMNISGLPSGGTAQLREIDGVANYTLPTATSVAAGTAVKLGLAGMTNTYTAGSYTSVMTTLDSTSTAIDTSTATSGLTFTAPTGSVASALTPTYTTAVAGTSALIMPKGIAISGNNVYVSDRYSSNINVFNASTAMLSTFAGNGVSTNNAASGTPLTTSMNLPSGLAVDGSGNLLEAEVNSSQVRKITSSNSAIIAGTSASAGFSGDGTTGPGQLNGPTGVAVDGSGNIYIADTSNYRIRKIDTSGNLTTFAGNGSSGTSGDGSAATSATLGYVQDVFYSSGSIYTVDLNCRVRKIVISTGIISTVAGSTCGFSGDGAAATSAQINKPLSVALDTAGNIYIADSGNNRIRMVSASTGFISTIAGTGTAGYSGDGGAATSAMLNTPYSVRVDSSGNIYIADTLNSRLREIVSGVISTVAGTGVSSYAGDGGPLSAARFWGATEMASDASGNMYVADTYNNVVRKIDQWGTVTTIAGTGVAGYSGDGSAATSATLNGPQGVTVDNAGNIYIGDTANGRVRKINASGVISTLATVANAARMTYYSGDGSVYVDSGNCLVDKITSAGSASIYAGTNCTTGFSGDGGLATSAKVNNVRGLLTDAAGNLYIADAGNSRIRKVDTSGIISTVAGGGAGSVNMKATSAAFVFPVGLNSDGLGDIIVNDGGTLRRFRDGGVLQTQSVAGAVSNGGTTCSLGSLYGTDYYSMVIRKVPNECAMAPLVNADSMSVPMNTARSWPILSNDWSRSNEMDPSSVTITSAPTNGAVTLTVPTTEATTLQANYTPAANYTGSDSFVYQACDTTRVLCNTATVSITVSSNQVTTVAGGLAEGYATNISFTPISIAQYRNYLFVTDAYFSTIRRYDIYSKQLVTVAGTGSGYGSTFTGPATASTLSGGAGVAVGPDGTIFVADYGSNSIKQISTAGTMSLLAGTGGAGNSADGTAVLSAQLTNPTSIALGPDGRIYVSSGSMVRSFTIGGTLSTVAGTGTAGSVVGGTAATSQLNSPYGLAVATNGDVYIDDQSNYAVRKVSGTAITTVLGTLGTSGNSASGTTATSAVIGALRGIAIDPNGNILVGDITNNLVRSFTVGGNVTTIAGGGSSLASGSTASAYATAGVNGLAINPSGGYWATVRYYGLVVGVNGYSTSSTVTNAIGTATGGSSYSSSYSGDGVSALQSQLGLTYFNGNMTADSSGNLYIADFAGNRIRKVDAITGLISTWAGDGTQTGAAYGAGGQLTFDTSGNLVYTSSDCKIRRRNADGSITVLVGGGCGFSGDGALATAAKVNGTVLGLVYAPNGDLYIADKANHRIRKIDHTTGFISTVAGNGTGGLTGDGGLASAATDTNPQSMAVDSAGNVYFCDAGTRIREIDTTGYITTVASGFSNVRDITVDSAGELFASDSTNNSIYKVANGVSTLITGSSGGFADNATYGSARFNSPTGLAVVGSDLYVADSNNFRIRKVAGVANSTSSALKSTAWSAAPAAVGHTNLRERFVLTPSSTTTSSKFMVSVPTGFTASSPTVVGKYGLTGTVTASLSGTILTFSYPSQSLVSSVPIAVAIEGVTNAGATGSMSSYTQLYDSAGATVTGVVQSNVLNNSSSAGPATTDPGFGSIWQRSLTATPSAATAINVNPSATADSTGAFSITNSGVLNGNALSLSATSMTGNGRTIAAATPDSTTSVASASFAANTWGLQLTSTTGTNGGATGSGLYSGLSTTPTSVLTGATAANVFTVTPRARVSYLTAAGTYNSTLTWTQTPGV